MKIINLEINEINTKLLLKYINKKPNSNLAILKKSQSIEFYTTLANDIEKSKLYPSQTWASFNTGIEYNKHKCYWYSDHLDYKRLLWNKLASRNKTVGIIGSIHSSKLPKDLFNNKNYKFLLPDCFSKVKTTKPCQFSSFQDLNNKLVGDSARVTNIFGISKYIFNFGIKFILSPRSFGLSFFSLKMISKILMLAIKYKNKEFLRMAQFPLLCSIFSDLFIKYIPDYSTLFSNHIAGSMHRYWYAYETNDFENKNKYSAKWIKRNKEAITIGFDLLDEYIGFLFKRKIFKESTIIITSSMGQEANPEFDNKFLAKYDGKISNIDLFLDKLKKFQKDSFDLDIKYQFERNMAPQYGFNFENQKDLDLNLVAKSIKEFILNLGLMNHIDIEGRSLVLTIDPYNDINFQEKNDLNIANKKLGSFGFKFFPIEDHHSGAHCPEGVLMVINPNDKLINEINKKSDSQFRIDYLDFHKIILNYFQ